MCVESGEKGAAALSVGRLENEFRSRDVPVQSCCDDFDDVGHV